MINNILPLPAELSIEKQLREVADSWPPGTHPTRPEAQALMHKAADELASQRRVISGLRLVEFLDQRIAEIRTAQFESRDRTVAQARATGRLVAGYRKRIKELEDRAELADKILDRSGKTLYYTAPSGGGYA